MRILILIFLILAVIFLFARGLKGTIFEVSLEKGRYGGILIARELFFLVLLGCFIFEVYGLKGLNIETYYITQPSLEYTTPIIIFCVGLLIVSIAFFSKTVFKKQLTVGNYKIYGGVKHNLNSMHFMHVVIAFIFLLVLLVHATGSSHAFIKSIIYGENLLGVRLSNRYEANTPPVLVSYLRISVQLAVVLLGLYGQKLNIIRYYIYFSLIIYSATIFGDKAPIFQIFILYLLARLHRIKIKKSTIILFLPILLMLLISSIYLIVKVQFPEMNTEEFFVYLIARLGVGQIQGVYEQFSLRLNDFSYILKELPFSGIFFELKSFGKDLAVSTFGYYLNVDEFGFMNSFFIGEALAIGGEILVFLSPILVAFSFCLICYLTVVMLNRWIVLSMRDAQIITALFVSSSSVFTGDLGGLLFGKGAISYVLLYFILYFGYRVLPRSINRFSFRLNIKKRIMTF